MMNAHTSSKSHSVHQSSYQLRSVSEFDPTRSLSVVNEDQTSTPVSTPRFVEQIQASDRFSNEIDDDKLRALLQGRRVDHVLTSQPLSRLPRQVQAFNGIYEEGRGINSVRQAEQFAKGNYTQQITSNSSPTPTEADIKQIFETIDGSQSISPQPQSTSQQTQLTPSQPNLQSQETSSSSSMDTNNHTVQDDHDRREKELDHIRRLQANRQVVQEFLHNEIQIEQKQQEITSQDPASYTSQTTNLVSAKVQEIDDSSTVSQATKATNRMISHSKDTEYKSTRMQSIRKEEAQLTSLQSLKTPQLEHKSLRALGQGTVSQSKHKKGLRHINHMRLQLKQSRIDPEVVRKAQERMLQQVTAPKQQEQQEQIGEAQKAEMREQVDQVVGGQAVAASIEPRTKQNETGGELILSHLHVTDHEQGRKVVAPGDNRNAQNDEVNDEINKNINKKANQKVNSETSHENTDRVVPNI